MAHKNVHYYYCVVRVPRWQKVRQSCAIQPRCIDVPDWVTTSAVQPTFQDSESLWSPAATQHLGGGWVWDIAVQPSPGVRDPPEHKLQHAVQL